MKLGFGLYHHMLDADNFRFEEAGVKLALHPDDPPVEVLRNSPRLVWKTEFYQKLIDLNPSRANTLEYCVGTMAGMVDGDVYQSNEYQAGLGRIGYVHLRNFRGKVPVYKETFIDEGDVDVRRIIEILASERYEGVIIPDHTPQLNCAAPWRAGQGVRHGIPEGLPKAFPLDDQHLSALPAEKQTKGKRTAVRPSRHSPAVKRVNRT